MKKGQEFIEVRAGTTRRMKLALTDSEGSL